MAVIQRLVSNSFFFHHVYPIRWKQDGDGDDDDVCSIFEI